jgi:hypothetical protein
LNLVCVCGATSRAGKTALAVTLLEALPRGSAAAVKFTTAEEVFDRCPRGTPCQVCNIKVPYRIVEDPATLRLPGTDTDRLAAAGASRVVWAIARASAVRPAWDAVRRALGTPAVVVMEGSTIVDVAGPDLSLFVLHPFLSPERWKPTSAALIARADRVVVNVPACERRAPAASVLAQLQRHRGGGGEVLLADVTRPLAEWAPDLSARLRAGRPSRRPLRPGVRLGAS